MAATPKQELHELVERLSDEEARRLSAALRGAGTAPTPSARPLTEVDVVLPEPHPHAGPRPDDETADEMIEAVRRWRREGGYA